MATPRERQALARARELALSIDLADGPNPRVGCVIITPDGRVVGEGAHRGAGTSHAEVAALAQAGAAAEGATAVVTLEPCNHTGRTGPCSQALIDAGIRRVVFGQVDPHRAAAGGSARLAQAGIDVDAEVESELSEQLNPAWTFAVTHGRPYVTWKAATSLDGRVAAADGTSRWITGPDARRDVHRLRAQCDAIVVGTGTARVDDPELTVRDVPTPMTGQPLRVVVGFSDLPRDSRLGRDAVRTVHLRTHDPREVLGDLADREVRHVLLEGGPTLAAAFLREGLVDEVIWYVAPVLLGAGPTALADAGIGTLAEAPRLREVRVEQVGVDARIRGLIG